MNNNSNTARKSIKIVAIINLILRERYKLFQDFWKYSFTIRHNQFKLSNSNSNQCGNNFPIKCNLHTDEDNLSYDKSENRDKNVAPENT